MPTYRWFITAPAEIPKDSARGFQRANADTEPAHRLKSVRKSRQIESEQKDVSVAAVAQRQEPRDDDQEYGAGARHDLQALAAFSGQANLGMNPPDADPEDESERVPEHID